MLIIMVAGCLPRTASILKQSPPVAVYSVEHPYQETFRYMIGVVEDCTGANWMTSENSKQALYLDLRLAEITNTVNPVIGSPAVLLNIEIDGSESEDRTKVMVWTAGRWNSEVDKIKAALADY